MAIIKSGILGGFSGSVAQVNGYNHKNKSIVRARKKANKQPSNRILKANGLKVINLAERYKYVALQLNRLMSLHMPEIKHDWNSLVKGYCTNNLAPARNTISPIILESNQLPNKVIVSTGFQAADKVLAIDYTNCRSARNHNGTIKRVAHWYTSRFDTDNSLISPIVSDGAGIQLWPSVDAEGQFTVLIMWIEEDGTGKKAKPVIGIYVNI